jgi:5-formyltetrahydrofolate cyclo-ligase
MSETRDPGDEEPGGSPPCFLHELGLDGAPADAQPARDVARWRKAERSRLIELRCALPAADRALHTAAIVRKLDEMISGRSNEIVSVYWPIRGEPDLRSWMRDACLRGLRVALPVAVELGQPMTFREWRPTRRWLEASSTGQWPSCAACRWSSASATRNCGSPRSFRNDTTSRCIGS